MKWKLRGIIEQNNDTLDELAKYLEIAYPTLSNKMNQHVEFKQSEIKKIKQRYNLTPVELDNIFFE